jgi:hypothetical protein
MQTSCYAEPLMGLRVSHLARFFRAGALRGLGAASLQNSSRVPHNQRPRILLFANQ